MVRGYVLPLGSVVMIKKGEVPVMVVGRGQLYRDRGTMGYFDYSGVAYPMGVVGSEFAFFNDEDVVDVLFEGYRDDQEREYAAEYQDRVDKSGYRKFSLEGLLG